MALSTNITVHLPNVIDYLGRVNKILVQNALLLSDAEVTVPDILVRARRFYYEDYLILDTDTEE